MHENLVTSQVCLFYLHHPTLPPYVFCAENEKDLEDWINALLNEISRELLIELPANVVKKATVRVKNGTVRLRDNFMAIKNQVEAKEKEKDQPPLLKDHIERLPVVSSKPEIKHIEIRQNERENEKLSDELNEICEGDYDDDEERICAVCGKSMITGNVVFHNSQLYPSECFSCFTCKRKLNTACINIDDHPYCRGCAAKILCHRKGTKTLSKIMSESSNLTHPNSNLGKL